MIKTFQISIILLKYETAIFGPKQENFLKSILIGCRQKAPERKVKLFRRPRISFKSSLRVFLLLLIFAGLTGLYILHYTLKVQVPPAALPCLKVPELRTEQATRSRSAADSFLYDVIRRTLIMERKNNSTGTFSEPSLNPAKLSTKPSKELASPWKNGSASERTRSAPSFEDYAINTSGCRIRNYDFNDAGILKKYFTEYVERCSPNSKPFVFYPKLNLTAGKSCIGFDANISRAVYGANISDWLCWYTEVRRDKTNVAMDKTISFGKSRPLTANVCPQAEFLIISCERPWRYYNQPLMLPLVKPVRKKLRQNNLGETPLSVLVVGMDAVSRLNAHRQFPETLKFLKTLGNLVELFGYNKIGENSAPNQIPLLSGARFCNASLQTRFSLHYADQETRYLWDEFESRGFRTMFYEEQWEYGLFVFPAGFGFRQVPTTYWPRPMFQAIDRWRHVTRNRCIGGDFPAKTYLDYTFNTFKILGPHRPLFSYSWLSELAHDELNGAWRADKNFRRFFEKMHEEGILNSTAVFFMSDHGFRNGIYRGTERGREEDLLPFGFILMPARYFAHYPEALTNLKINSRRLVTVYDLHASMLELADAWDEFRSIRTANGLSLFSNVVPETRTCADVGIVTQYCSCLKSKPITDQNHLQTSLADVLIDTLNGVVKNTFGFSYCERWSLNNTESFSKMYESPSETMNVYRIVISTTPYARFEAMANFSDARSWTLLARMNRIDWYRETSSCAEGHPNQAFCHCKT